MTPPINERHPLHPPTRPARGWWPGLLASTLLLAACPSAPPQAGRQAPPGPPQVHQDAARLIASQPAQAAPGGEGPVTAPPTPEPPSPPPPAR